MIKKVYIGSDHAGFFLKEKIKEFLKKENVSFEDIGSFELDESDDYPRYAFKLAELVAKNNSRGILICGSGLGMCIAANKVKGIRAVNVCDEETAKLSRTHNNSNVLCLGANNISFSKAKRIIYIWLTTSFSKKERHKRRILEIINYEKK